MSRRLARHLFMSQMVAALLALIMVNPGQAASVTWLKPLDLRVKTGTQLTDAAFSGQNIALTWTEPGDGNIRNMGLSVSTNAGTSFQPRRMFTRSQQGAVEICGQEVYVAFVRHGGPDKWSVEVASRDLAEDVYDTKHIYSSESRVREPDIACSAGRLFVSWFHEERDGWRRFVATALLSDALFEPPMDLGVDPSPYGNPRGLVLAASDRTAYALYGGAAGRLRMKRFLVGPAPDFSLDARPSETVAPGTSGCPDESPVIATNGSAVAIAWGRNSGFLARFSNDRGATWSSIRDATGVDCGAIVEGYDALAALAMHGSMTIFTAFGCGFFDCSSFMGRTSDGFRSTSTEGLGENQSHVVGFVVVNGQTRLADVFSTSFRIRFRRQS